MKDSDRATKLSMQLFQGDTFINWIRLFNPDEPWEASNIYRDTPDIASPIYYASQQQLLKPLRLLLEKGTDVNTQGGEYDNALQAASIENYEAIVALLLEKGANVNAQCREYGNVLQAASARGHESNCYIATRERGRYKCPGR